MVNRFGSVIAADYPNLRVWFLNSRRRNLLPRLLESAISGRRFLNLAAPYIIFSMIMKQMAVSSDLDTTSTR